MGKITSRVGEEFKIHEQMQPIWAIGFGRKEGLKKVNVSSHFDALVIHIFFLPVPKFMGR